jgi:dinuclear metal center YbgI/SA1388 family protein
MVSQQQLSSHLEQLLQPAKFQDYCPNGLQVAGRDQIKSIIGGVTASLEFIRAARDRGADALLVHHGLFWHNDDRRIVGLLKARLQTLLEHELNLFAYHLPLDLHPSLGNNVQLAQQLGWAPSGKFGDSKLPMGLYTELDTPITGAELAKHLQQTLVRAPLHIAVRTLPVRRIGWCTGAAQNLIQQAYEAGLDAYISGEISEQTVHQAKEYQLDYFAAGHHATERYGIQALLCELEHKFNVTTEFMDLHNPV